MWTLFPNALETPKESLRGGTARLHRRTGIICHEIAAICMSNCEALGRLLFERGERDAIQWHRKVGE
jgi:hypothetical protein